MPDGTPFSEDLYAQCIRQSQFYPADFAVYITLNIMRTHADIFAETSTDLDLQSFALRVFAILGISDFEERESSHYVDGHYFRHKANDLEIKITYADEIDFERYRFWLPISSASAAFSATEQAHMYAKKLSESGWSTFVPSDGWTLKGWDGDGIRYDV